MDVRAALRQVFETISSPPAVAWENREFTPTAGTPYVRETLLWGGERPASIGPPTLVEAKGEEQFDLIYPLNSGVGAMSTLADAIKAAFYPGLYINALVFVDESSSMPAVTTDLNYTKAVRVKWRAYYSTP